MIRYFMLFIALLLLLSCSKPTSNDNTPQPFSLKIKLLDSNQQPMNGYAVSVAPDIENLWYSRPITTISFDLAATYHVKLQVQDYFGNHIKYIIDDTLATGCHRVVWNSTDDSGELVNRDGLYKFRIEYFDNNQSVFCDSTYGYQLTWVNAACSPYKTNSQGICTIEDLLPFPILYNEQIIPKTNENSEDLGSLEFSDQVWVRVCQIDSTGATVGDSRYKVCTIHDGSNTLDLNWEELTVEYKSGHFSGRINQKHTLIKHKLNKDVPKLLNNLHPIYPNPYN